MLRWDSEYNLLMADSLDEARTIAHSSGPRQVGVMDPILDAIVVYLVLPKGSAVVTHSPDHWGVPAWHSETL